MIVYLFVYAIVWFVLFFLLKFIKSKYLVTPNQRYNAVTVLHALYCTVYTLIYFTFFQSIADYVMPQTVVSFHLLAMAGAFYLFALVIVFFIGRKIDKFGIFHHLTMALFIGYFLINSELPLYYTLLAFFILPGIFFNSFLVYKESEGSNPAISNLLFRLNGQAWLIVRILLFIVFSLYALYCEYLEVNPATIPYRNVLLPVMLTFCFFNTYYYIFIKRKLKKMNSATTLLVD